MIYCPTCGAETQVTETRAALGSARRRRICKSTKCGARITTIEVLSTGHSRLPDERMLLVSLRRMEELREILDSLIPTPDLATERSDEPGEPDANPKETEGA